MAERGSDEEVEVYRAAGVVVVHPTGQAHCVGDSGSVVRGNPTDAAEPVPALSFRETMVMCRPGSQAMAADRE
jgi:hypothetical protein